MKGIGPRAVLLAFISSALLSSAVAQVPDAGRGKCVEQSSDGRNWHSCGSSSSHSSSSNLSSSGSGGTTSTPPKPPELEASPPRADIPGPNYTPEYLNRLRSGDVAREEAEKPFTYMPEVTLKHGTGCGIWAQEFLSKVNALYGGYCIPSTSQTCAPVRLSYDDSRLLADWAAHLANYPAAVIFLYGQDPYLVKQVLDELNKKTVEKIETTLRHQLLKTEPFDWDSPQLRASKLEQVRRALDYYRTETPIDVDYRSCPGRCGAYEANGYYLIQPGNYFQKLLKIARDGNWRHLDEPDPAF